MNKYGDGSYNGGGDGLEKSLQCNLAPKSTVFLYMFGHNCDQISLELKNIQKKIQTWPDLASL